MKNKKKNKKIILRGGGRVRGVGLGGQGGWERRIEAFVKIQKKKNMFLGGGRVRGGGGSGWGGGGVRVDWNGEVKLVRKFKKKKKFFWGGGGGGRVGGCQG